MNKFLSFYLFLKLSLILMLASITVHGANQSRYEIAKAHYRKHHAMACEKYVYTTCPQKCVKACKPASCDSGNCTAECDGPGSCTSAKVEVPNASPTAPLSSPTTTN